MRLRHEGRGNPTEIKGRPQHGSRRGYIGDLEISPIPSEKRVGAKEEGKVTEKRALNLLIRTKERQRNVPRKGGGEISDGEEKGNTLKKNRLEDETRQETPIERTDKRPKRKKKSRLKAQAGCER